MSFINVFFTLHLVGKKYIEAQCFFIQVDFSFFTQLKAGLKLETSLLTYLECFFFYMFLGEKKY
jgi:hypothetical protein